MTVEAELALDEEGNFLAVRGSNLSNLGGHAAAFVSLQKGLGLINFFAQPFFCAEPWTKRSGTHVPLAEALKTCASILDGAHDDLPIGAFYLAGGIDEIRARAAGAA